MAQAANRSLGRSINVLTNISAWTYAFLIIPTVGLLVVNSILIQQNADLSSGNLIACMVLDVVFVVLFLYGFITLAHDLGEFSEFFAKPLP